MNCNDFIIKNNKDYVRDFETMYNEVEDPWGQEARGEEDTSFRLLISSLKNICFGKRMVDIGCGPGHLSRAFKEQLKIDSYFGCDISKSAINKASELNPEMEFFELNIIYDSIKLKADLVTALKTLYYCAPEIDATIKNIYKMLLPDGFLAYSYNIKEDSFSKKFLDIETLRDKLVNSGFKKAYISDYYYINNERIAIDIFQKKGL